MKEITLFLLFRMQIKRGNIWMALQAVALWTNSQIFKHAPKHNFVLSNPSHSKFQKLILRNRTFVMKTFKHQN